MIQWLRSLFCQHLNWHIPVLPYVGARNIKVCDDCPAWKYLTAEDRANPPPHKAWR